MSLFVLHNKNNYYTVILIKIHVTADVFVASFIYISVLTRAQN